MEVLNVQDREMCKEFKTGLQYHLEWHFGQCIMISKSVRTKSSLDNLPSLKFYQKLKFSCQKQTSASVYKI